MNWNIAGTVAVAAASAVLAGCASGTRLHADHVPPGALRVAQPIQLVKGEMAFDAREKELYDVLSKGGISDNEIRSGTVALARVLCCGTNERVNAIMFFAPISVPVAVGDFVEVRGGRAGDARSVNVATRVWQKDGNPGACQWVPDIPNLAARVIYCAGMKEQGWVQQTGLWNFWMKAP